MLPFQWCGYLHRDHAEGHRASPRIRASLDHGELSTLTERSGARIGDAGRARVSVRESVRAGTTKANDKRRPEVTSRFDAPATVRRASSGAKRNRTDVNQY